MPRRSAFTLIELLIVVAIIGILAAIAVPNFLDAIVRAKIASTYARMKNTHSAITSYMLDHQMFPPHGLVGSYDRPFAFSVLTTPVNYLGSIDTCVDSFRQYHIDPNVLDERVISKTYFMYDAKPVYQFYLVPNLKKYYDEKYRYLLASTGPDGWSNNLYLAIVLYSDLLLQNNPDLIYSSTNGLRSCGDIISTNVRTGESQVLLTFAC